MHHLFFKETEIDFNARFVEFGMPLWGRTDSQAFFLRRESTIGYAEKAVNDFFQFGMRTVIAAGSKGIGKSCESIFMIKELMDREVAVLYNNWQEKMLIVGKAALEKHYEPLKIAFGKAREPMIFKPGVYDFDKCQGLSLFEALSEAFPSVICVVDVGENFGDAIDVRMPQIIISSPNSIKLRRTGEVKNPLFRYLKVWTKEEIFALNERLPSTPLNSAHELVKKSEEDLNRLINMFGYTPRYVFAERTLERARSDIRTAVNDVSLDTWKDVLTQPNYTKLPKLVPGVLVHIAPWIDTNQASGEPPDESNLCTVTFASDYVRKIVLRKFYIAQRNELVSLANSVKGESRLFAFLRGELLQQKMHEDLQRQPCRLEIRSLTNPGETLLFDVPELHVKRFNTNDARDLQEMAENDFCIANSPTFPSVESFFVVRRRLIGIPEDGLCIVCLQATTAKSHPVKRHGLKQIQKQCCQLLNLAATQLPICVIFVTTPNGIRTPQTFGKRKEAFDATVRQFVCTDIDFTETLKMFPDDLPEATEEEDDEHEEV